MPRPSKPWFWKRRKSWFCTIRGKRIELGPDKDEAALAFHAMMSKPRVKPTRNNSVVVLVDEFVDWVQKNQAPDTYRWYKDRLQSFCDRYPDLTVSALKPQHIQKWIDGMDVAKGTKRNFARSVMRCMKWAEEQEYIEKSPVSQFKKPRGGVDSYIFGHGKIGYFVMVISGISKKINQYIKLDGRSFRIWSDNFLFYDLMM